MTSIPRVSLQACSDYEPHRLRDSLRQLLEPLGGIAAFVKPGMRVLIKPNLLGPHPRQDAVCTDPEVIVAVAEMVLEAGGHAVVGDSPGLVRAEKVLRTLEVWDRLKSIGCELVEFDSFEERSGGTFHSIEIATAPLEADLVINLPKLKTHGMMVLTLGVKNMYGCVVGRRKAAYHLHVKDSRDLFAKLVGDICEAVAPGLTILDGVIGMEGEGPGSGIPRNTGFLAASQDPWALDLVTAWILGYSVEEVPLLREYKRRLAAKGLVPDAEVVGADWRTLSVKDFVRARSFSVSFRIPGWLRRPLRKLVLPSPAIVKVKCIGCGNCAKSCPAEVIAIVDGKADIALSGCIRCFCCAEVCPVKAVEVKRPLLAFLREHRPR
ncbi:MAG: DUF362 domain-containing protein [Planctomycetota bacterium]